MINIVIDGTKLPKSVKLASKIATFCFEEQYGELDYFTDGQKKKLQDVQRMLMKLASKYSTK